VDPAEGTDATDVTGGVVAVAGEVIMDMVPAGGVDLFRAAPGGSPANVAVGLARLGVPARLLARLSGDVLGRRLRSHLAGNGVDLSHAVDASEPSSLAIVVLAEDGSADYDFRVDGTADWQWTDAEVADAVDGVLALHVGSLGLTTPPGGPSCAGWPRVPGRPRRSPSTRTSGTC
jgi:fructokinase